MDKIEEYFDRNRNLVDGMEMNPRVTEADFMEKLHRKRLMKRLRISALTLTGAAAAIIAVMMLPFRGTGNIVDPALEMIAGYEDGVKPLRAEMETMEADSQLCREMDLSAVISSLMDSSYGFADSLKDLDDRQRAEAVRSYCDRQMAQIRELYRECVTAYETGTTVN